MDTMRAGLAHTTPCCMSVTSLPTVSVATQGYTPPATVMSHSFRLLSAATGREVGGAGCITQWDRDG
jgi:hypothetical protein